MRFLAKVLGSGGTKVIALTTILVSVGMLGLAGAGAAGLLIVEEEELPSDPVDPRVAEQLWSSSPDPCFKLDDSPYYQIEIPDLGEAPLGFSCYANLETGAHVIELRFPDGDGSLLVGNRELMQSLDLPRSRAIHAIGDSGTLFARSMGASRSNEIAAISKKITVATAIEQVRRRG
jgi:hypothetical protein